MKFALCNEVFCDRSLRECFATIAEIGYTGVELAPFTLADPDARPGVELVDVRHLQSEQRTSIRTAAEECGLEVVGLHWLLAKTEGLHLTSRDQSVRSETTAYFCELAKLCQDVGGKVLVLGSPQQRNRSTNMSNDEAFEIAAATLKDAMPEFETRGVTLALGPLGPEETDFLNTAAEAVRLCEQIGSDACRLLLDVKAMSTEPDSMSELIHTNQRYLAHFHANDPNRLGPGMGEADLSPALKALGEINYAGWVSVEPFRYEPSREDVARWSLEYLRGVQ